MCSAFFISKAAIGIRLHAPILRPMIGEMSTTQPTRPKEHTSEEEKAIILERLKTLEVDRKTARPMDEVFQRITKKLAP